MNDDSTPIIRVDNLTKIYKIYDKPKDRLIESVIPFGRKYHKPFSALQDVSFQINKGETIGIVGKNGSGKSTLLKILTGVLTPTSGLVHVNGKVSALLELGAGFNPELTGMENIYFNGTIMGYSKEQMDEKVDDIISFADIGDFINQPMKTYSSGMFVRLAFSVATNVQPDILIVDEALAVGDMFFQTKCMVRMKEMVDNGATLIYVSHDPGAVKSLCQKSIWLENGKLILFDKSDVVIEKYFSAKVASEQKILMSSYLETEPDSKVTDYAEELVFVNNIDFEKRASFQRIQNGKAVFKNIQLLNDKQQEITSVDFEQRVILRMAIEVNEDLPALALGYHIRDKNGVDIVYSDTAIEDKTIDKPRKGDKYIIDWHFEAALIQGLYNIACVMSVPLDISIGQVDFCDFVPLAIQFNMSPRKGSVLYGSVHWENDVAVKKL